MAHNLFGERFYGTRKPAWHNLGKIFETPLMPSIAVKEIGLDYTVHKMPLVAQIEDDYIQTDKIAIMREPTNDSPEWTMFGTASDKYEIVQNVELAHIMDPLAEIWSLETMGAIAEGKTTFMSLATETVEIGNDPIKGYFLVTDTKDGGTATKLIYTPVRVVCQNTLTSGLRQATVSVSIPHITGARDQLEARINLIKKAQAAIDETTVIFRQLASKKVSMKQVARMFEMTYPHPKVPSDAEFADYTQEDLGDVLFKGVQDKMYAYNYYVAQADELREAATELYVKLNDENTEHAGTAWNAWNAVVESADYRDGGANPEISALFGARAREKRKAFQLAIAIK